MPTIQSADLWRETGRYDAYGPEMLRITDRHKREMLYGPTNEDMITALFRDNVKSYRDLPRILYHIQWKFRDEVRPRFGVMRGREFLMKDAYSFDLDEAGARHSYNRMFIAYLRTFARMGLTAIPMQADTGPIGGDLSHEFIILAPSGRERGLLPPGVGAGPLGRGGRRRRRRPEALRKFVCRPHRRLCRHRREARSGARGRGGQRACAPRAASRSATSSISTRAIPAPTR
jgi:hypothetical protein